MASLTFQSPSFILYHHRQSMRVAAGTLVTGIVLLAGADAQNATYNAQQLTPSMYTPASSPAKCSPDGTITVTQVNQAYDTQYMTQWETTTYTESRPAKTITTCTGSMGGYGSTQTVTATMTTSLSCTGKPTTVTSYQNCVPVSHHSGATDSMASSPGLCVPSIADNLATESVRLWLSKPKAGRQEKSSASVLQHHHSTGLLFAKHHNCSDLQIDSDCYCDCDFDHNQDCCN